MQSIFQVDQFRRLSSLLINDRNVYFDVMCRCQHQYQYQYQYQYQAATYYNGKRHTDPQRALDPFFTKIAFKHECAQLNS